MTSRSDGLVCQSAKSRGWVVVKVLGDLCDGTKVLIGSGQTAKRDSLSGQSAGDGA